MTNKSWEKIEKKFAGVIRNAAEASAKNAAGKKLIIMVYEPEVPEAVKEFVKKENK